MQKGHLSQGAYLMLGVLIGGVMVLGCESDSGFVAVESLGVGKQIAKSSGDVVVAVVDGERITRAMIYEELGEAIGGEVLGEVVLGRLLEKELERVGLVIEESDLEEERGLVSAAMGRAVGREGGPTDEVLMRRLRAQRGLGPERFSSAIWRSAALRQLARFRYRASDGASEEEVRLAYEVRHGPRLRVRLAVFGSEREAAELRGELVGIQSKYRSGALAIAAIESSRDVSAGRGGLIDGMSLKDARYPAALVGALESVGIGDVPPVIALESGFAVAMVEAHIEPLEESVEEMEAALAGVRNDLAQARQRADMDRIAAGLLGRAEVTVLEPSVRWSWESRDSVNR